jgi:hypothetical protein
MDGREVAAMTQPHGSDPRELLGGYATGTLSEEEKARLFRAALEDQALFNALADEEALRELLAEPGARQRLLEALGQPRIVPLWRRPAMLSVAAGVLLLVTSTVMIRRQPQMLEKTVPGTPEAAAKPAEAPVKSKKLEVGPELEMRRASAPSEVKSDKLASPAQGEALKEEEAPKETVASGDRARLSSGGGIAASASPPAPAAAPTLQAAPAAPAMAREEKSAGMRMADGFHGDAEGPRSAKKASVQQAMVLPAPNCTLEKLGEGRFRLKIVRIAQGHLYVLQREGGKVSVLTSSRTTSDDVGRSVSLFEIKGSGILDVYVLQSRVPEPERLPAEGAVSGQRQRLRLGD